MNKEKDLKIDVMVERTDHLMKDRRGVEEKIEKKISKTGKRKSIMMDPLILPTI